MEKELNNEVLKIYLKGEINSSNSLDYEKEIEDIIKESKFKTLELDCENLNYVSSAGLRIFLKLKQKYNDVHIINTKKDVYDILEMTGFVNIMDVKKALKNVSVEGCSVIGTGFFSTVYRLDKDMIIKVFERTSDIKELERELNLAKGAFIRGIPTAISYDIVKVDGKLGVRFEMLDCMSLRDTFRECKDDYDKYLTKYVDLLKKINSTKCENSDVPDMKKAFLGKVEVIKPYLEKEKYNKLLKMVSSIKESNNFIHGDCHFKNIMVQGEDLLLIDMDTLSKGHYIFELASLRAPYIAFDEDDIGNSERFLGMKNEFCIKLYNDIIDKYFDDANDDIKNKIALVCYLHMVWWCIINKDENKQRFEGCKKRLLDLLDKYDDLEV